MIKPDVVYLARATVYDAISPPHVVAYGSIYKALGCLIAQIEEDVGADSLAISSTDVVFRKQGNTVYRLTDVVIYEATTGHNSVWYYDNGSWISPYAIHSFLNVSTRTIRECLRG